MARAVDLTTATRIDRVALPLPRHSTAARVKQCKCLSEARLVYPLYRSGSSNDGFAAELVVGGGAALIFPVSVC